MLRRDMADSQYDVVVIGSGPGGLCAATALARQGKHVLVLEQHFFAGGNAQTFRRFKAFDFDVGIHTLDDCGPDGTVPRILNDIGADVAFEPLDPNGFDVLRFSDREFRVPVGWPEYRERLLQMFPEEGAAIDRYVDYMTSVLARVSLGPSFVRLLLLKRPSQLLKPLLHGDPSYLARLRQKPAGPVAERIESELGRDFGELTLGELFDALKLSTPLRHVLGGQNFLYGTCWTRASVAFHALTIDRYLRGVYVPKGGSRAFVTALIGAFESAGGTLRVRARVQRVTVKQGRVQGVVLDSGEEIAAPIVVSNADAKYTVSDLLGSNAASQQILNQAAAKQMATPLFVTYVALNVPPAELGLSNANYWLFPQYNIVEQYAACARGELPTDPLVYVSVSSLKDRHNTELAPPGCSNLQLMALAPAAPEAWGLDTSVTEKRYRHTEPYTATKKRYEQRLISVVETMLPGVIRDVRWVESATPLTHRRYTGATDGTGYGLDHTPEQFLTGRFPLVSSIAGLYFVGANTLFGHGVTGAVLSGRACVQAVLAQE